MARKTALSAENLMALGAGKLAQLILDEAEGNAAFRKRANAALAGAQGPDKVAALIDRRLAALEKARAMIAWEKERAFAADLAATVETIAKELAPLDPAAAVQRLLCFVDTHATVFERIDDSSGRIQAVYWGAIGPLPEWVAALSEADRLRLPDRLMASLAKDTHGLADRIAALVAPLLPEPALAAWDQALQRQPDGEGSDFLAVRQIVADGRGDLDLYIALEIQRSEWRQDPLRVAEKLLTAGRLDEALDWVRRERKSSIAYATAADMADGRIVRPHDIQKVTLEARILEARKDRSAAQALRWAAFETTLDAQTLRDYLRKLEDFIEYEETERAFAIADAFPHTYVALAFFIEWPRLDRAARLVLANRDHWEGRHYDTLGDAAAILEADFPLAATVLYRALLDDILGRARSPAYGAGARHLARLEALAPGIADWDGVDDHAAYALSIRKTHGRKAAFWSAVEGKGRR
mgnify:CR=1 FL=1